MRPSAEQQAIIECQGNAKINACAGAGKTSTLVFYAKARPNARILYIAYNKSVKEESIRRFARAGVKNIDVETAHAMAYSAIMRQGGYTLHPQGNLQPRDILDYCNIPQQGNKGLVLAKHILNCLSLFCNSAFERVHQVDYTGGSDLATRQFAARHLDIIYGHAKELLLGMYDGAIDMTHDAYLKLYQLQRPVLPYTHILFDEGQDANPCMLDIFKRQTAVKVIVGDTYQSIYSFNGAVNSLELLDYPLYRLTNSYRFGADVAWSAMTALRLKYYLGQSLEGFVVNGLGSGPVVPKTTGVIARSNMGLLQKAIELICEDGGKGAFEGGIAGYSCLSGGGGLFDILELYLGADEKRKINRERAWDEKHPGKKRPEKDPFISSFRDYDALQEYQKQTDDRDLGLMMSAVKQYGAALFPLLRQIRESQVPRQKADVIFSSVHRSKGQEYDRVIMTNDFIHGKKLLALLGGGGKRGRNGATPAIKELSEEINILYVAVTRSKGDVDMPFVIIPDDIPQPRRPVSA